MLIKCLEELDVEPFEYVFLSEDTLHTSSTFNFHFPKVMPQGGGKPKVTPTSFNSNIFINDPSCKPKVSGTISTQNFVNIKRHFHTDFSFRARPDGIIPAGTRFIIQVMHGNIRDLYVRDVT